MKSISRFIPKKELHNGQLPFIIDFDYSEMTMRLGLLFSDSTVESIHLPNFLFKSVTDFESTSLNELLFHLPKRLKKIYYIHMLNKWLTFSETIDELFLLDL